MKIEKTDKTIEDINEWIQKELKTAEPAQGDQMLPEMIKALAKLISARATCY